MPEKRDQTSSYIYSDTRTPRPILNASALKGVDAHKVAVLEDFAGPLGFQLGLASVECHLRGQAEDLGSQYVRRRRGGNFWANDSSDVNLNLSTAILQ